MKAPRTAVLSCPTLLAILWITLSGFATAHAETLAGNALVKALQNGGYVIVMRHASSPRDPPSKEKAEPDNTTPERQLDDMGRNTATAMGKALRELKIPVGEVWSSPTYRARETVKLAGLGTAKTAPELGDRGKSMQGLTEAEFDWLRKKATTLPKTSANTFIVTHVPNIAGAFKIDGSSLSDGEALIFKPDGKGGTEGVARVRIEEWSHLGRQ